MRERVVQWHGAARTWDSGRDGIYSAVVWVDGVVWGRCRGAVVGSVRVRIRAEKGLGALLACMRRLLYVCGLLAFGNKSRYKCLRST